jgi:hypothetical protein
LTDMAPTWANAAATAAAARNGMNIGESFRGWWGNKRKTRVVTTPKYFPKGAEAQ